MMTTTITAATMTPSPITMTQPSWQFRPGNSMPDGGRSSHRTGTSNRRPRARPRHIRSQALRRLIGCGGVGGGRKWRNGLL